MRRIGNAAGYAVVTVLWWLVIVLLFRPRGLVVLLARWFPALRSRYFRE